MPSARTPRPIRTVSCYLLWFALFSLPLLAQAPPSADTFVSSSTPKTNYGPSISLLVGPGTTSYVQFNLSGIPAGATISKATLRLYVDAVSGSGTLDLFSIASSWSESKVTYNTRPTQQSVSAIVGSSIPITSANCNQFLLVDITPLAKGWLNGTIPNNGVALALTSGSGSFSFDSKESLLTGNGPELEIALASGTGPQGPMGPAGPQGPAGPTGGIGAQGPQGAAGPAGAQGPQGLPGPMGLMGATGPQGPVGPAGTNGTGFKFRNAFDPSASYAVNDVTTYNSSTYVALSANSGPANSMPDQNPAAWSVMAAQGAAGPTGAAGPAGAPGLPGSEGVPGSQGPQGLPGASGAPGQSVMTFTEPAGANCSGGGVRLVGVNATTFVCNGSSSGTTFFTISGTLSGLAATTSVTLLDNGTDQITLSANGSFTFPTPLATGESYTVTVLTQPSGGTCTVGNSTGTVSTSGVNGVSVTCTVPVVVTTLASNLDHPSGIAVDSTNVYWANLPTALGNQVVEYIPVGGGKIINACCGSGAIAIDLNNIYIMNQFALYRFAKGSQTETTIATVIGGSQYAPFYPVFGLAVDAQNAYFINQNGVWSAPLGGNTVQPTVFASALTGSQAFAVAVDDTNVYWTVTGPGVGSVMMLAKTGGTPRVIASGLNFPSDIAVDSTNVYWTNNGGGTVMMAPIAGGPPTTVASGQSFPFGIAVDSENIYWTNNGTSSGGSVMKVPITGGTPVVIASGQNFPMGITLDQTNVYWTNNTGPASSSATGSVVKATK
jgi:hypothetical protein